MKIASDSEKKKANRALLGQLKERLRREVREGVREMGVLDRLFAENFELAGAAGRLLELLRRYEFPRLLDEADQTEYQAVMRELSVIGLRCQLLAEESQKQNCMDYLRSTSAATGRVH